MTRQFTFVLGGARSGKSSYAEEQAKSDGGRVLFVATAEALDDEMRARIARHRAERPVTWQTLEAPLDVGRAIASAFISARYDCVVLDCITLLVSNLFMTLPEDYDEDAATEATLREIAGLLSIFTHTDARWIVISNEVGMGVVPPTRLGRVYRDVLGRVNQRLAYAADEVVLLVAGHPFKLRG